MKNVKRWIGSLAMALCLLLTAFYPGVFGVGEASNVYAIKAPSDMKGIWLSCFDYESLGMRDVDEQTYRSNVADFLENASVYGINTVFLHVRSYDDAIWKSKTFPASSYISSKASRKKTAAETYTYDPLKVFLRVANTYGMEVHAWMNPYRINDSNIYLDPAKTVNQDRIKKAIKELAKYDIVGIHFDDYFYHGDGYVKNANSTKVYNKSISPAKKRKNVNKLIKSVYSLCHRKGLVFGISPQANYDNDMNAGADVKTWLSKKGYVDYLVPQIYWTNQHAQGTMYSDRLHQFDSLHKNNAKLYVGLALHRTGTSVAGDPGWMRSDTNMMDQIAEADDLGWDGYIFFSARFLYNPESAVERDYLKQTENYQVEEYIGL